jgi:hypothetical protein
MPSKDRSDGEVHWYSFASREKQEDVEWCYHRKVVIEKQPPREYIHWPLGEMDQVVEKDLTTRSCCYPGPRTEDGPLEHGFQPKIEDTTVWRGQGEPKDRAWISVGGAIYLTRAERTIRLDLTLSSRWIQKGSEYEYVYEIEHLGDSETVLRWTSVEDSPFILEKLRILSSPLKPMKWTQFVGRETKPPRLVKRNVIVQFKGEPIFQIAAPAFIPASPLSEQR